MQRKTKFTEHDINVALQTAQAYAKGSHGQWFATLNAGNVLISRTDSVDDTLQLNDCQIVLERGEIACGLLGVRPATYFVLYVPAVMQGPDDVIDVGMSVQGSHLNLPAALRALYLDFTDQWLDDANTAIAYADIVNRDII